MNDHEIGLPGLGGPSAKGCFPQPDPLCPPGRHRPGGEQVLLYYPNNHHLQLWVAGPGCRLQGPTASLSTFLAPHPGSSRSRKTRQGKTLSRWAASARRNPVAAESRHPPGMAPLCPPTPATAEPTLIPPGGSPTNAHPPRSLSWSATGQLCVEGRESRAALGIAWYLLSLPLLSGPQVPRPASYLFIYLSPTNLSSSSPMTLQKPRQREGRQSYEPLKFPA